MRRIGIFAVKIKVHLPRQPPVDSRIGQNAGLLKTKGTECEFNSRAGICSQRHNTGSESLLRNALPAQLGAQDAAMIGSEHVAKPSSHSSVSQH
jgi:hypothetical protein